MAVNGNFELLNVDAGDTIDYLGVGDLVFNVNCDGGTAQIHGNPELTNNGSTVITRKDANNKLDKLLTDVGTAGDGLTDLGGMSATMRQQVSNAVLPPINTAFPDIPFLRVDSTDHVTPVTGATGKGVTRSIDGGAYAAGTGTEAEIGNGSYSYDASAADMNGKVIKFRFTATGGTPGAADDTFVTTVTGG